MSKTWDIGLEAMHLDKQDIRSRVKIEKHSIKKIAVAFIVYCCTMAIFLLI